MFAARGTLALHGVQGRATSFYTNLESSYAVLSATDFQVNNAAVG